MPGSRLRARIGHVWAGPFAVFAQLIVPVTFAALRPKPF